MNNHENQWYALYTRSKHEKKVQFYLEQKDIETFLPMRMEIRQWSDRKKKVKAILFPNYIFVRTHPVNFWEITSLPGAIRLVGIGRTPSSIPDTVIDSIQKVVGGDTMIEVGSLNLSRKDKVRVTNGPFMGVEGRFVRLGVKNMLIIEIELLNRSIMLELSPGQVQKLEKLDNKQRAVAH